MERGHGAQRVLGIVGENIRRRRRALGLTQAELADRFDSHENFLGGVERGQRNISILNLCYLAAALGVDPAELLEGLTKSEIEALPGKSPKRLRSAQ